ncbi:PLD nuclease N-terminal domain-containing protein [Solimonas flava]|uniref:PLD nuclease N-terminal domain-containing protein n=1 Tax=Solimonas flava TaxID=415849 RepID=UPI0004171ED2|nr:PLD nuclease N-terminal domain-containing protein [Solimonas flava]
MMNFNHNMGLWGFLVLVADIWAIVSVVQSALTTGKKVLWILLILFLPVLGFILWLLVGPRGR